ncbi:MAG: FtsX-like permease family protein [Saprospiraceae bacterium]|nr:ABC transporter permease [Lewinella sp.]
MIKKWAERFFEWYCHPDYYEDIRGDLDELYRRQTVRHSDRRAGLVFAFEVLLLFRPSIIRPLQWPFLTNTSDMFKNYFKISLRNLFKYPSNTLIHVLGLALGLTAFLLIDQYISFEKSYDTFHPGSEHLFRLTTDNVKDGEIQVRDAMSFAPSGKALQEELPEVIAYTTTLKPGQGDVIFRKGEIPVEENQTLLVDSGFLQLFGYAVLDGDKTTMLREPGSIVLTRSQAEKYFGTTQQVVGKTIEVLGIIGRPFEVTGVIEDVPKNTHYGFNTLISLSTMQERIQNDAWNGYNYYTYLRLQQDADVEVLRSKLPALSYKYLGEETNLQFNLQAVEDIHLYSDFTFEPEIHGSAKAVSFLSLISMFILLIAWVNYINLSTARAMERAREVGLRKVVGARKGQLVGQFLMESLLINFGGALLALFLVILLLPYFNDLVGKDILIQPLTNLNLLQKLFFFFLFGTVVTGLYPALMMSSFRPIGILRGSFGRTKKGGVLRKTLVVFQFASSLILVAGTVIIYQQIRYMTTRDMGIDTEQVISFQNAPDRDKYEAFTNELRRLNGIAEVGGIGSRPGGGSSEISSSSGGIQIVGKTDRLESTMYVNDFDDHLMKTLDLDVLYGRNFDRETAADSNGVILNLSLLKALKVDDPTSVVGEYVRFGRDPENDKFPIVGVVNDYNRSSLKSQVEPTIFFFNQRPAASVIKLNGQKTAATIDQIQQVWSRFFPQAPFTYSFLDQRFERLYMEDRKFGRLFLNFAFLAIFVASMGLYGLSSYLSLQRTKEVGVRKVLGASVSNIVLLFFKDFVWLILIGILLGLPLTFIGMNDWLSGYAYRINFPWWVLLLTVIMITLIAFFTVSIQTLKLALSNPAKTIRQE